jgi:hypothetical protein
MRENLSSGSIPFRKAYLQSLIDVIEVDDTQIRIRGNKDVLERAVLASRNGTIPSSQMSTSWRSLGESNPCFSLESQSEFEVLPLKRCAAGCLKALLGTPSLKRFADRVGTHDLKVRSVKAAYRRHGD